MSIVFLGRTTLYISYIVLLCILNRRDFNETTLKTLGTHLRLSESVIEAGLAIARGDGIDDTNPLVKALREEGLVKLYGEEVLLFEFVTVILRQGK